MAIMSRDEQVGARPSCHSALVIGHSITGGVFIVAPVVVALAVAHLLIVVIAIVPRKVDLVTRDDNVVSPGYVRVLICL